MHARAPSSSASYSDSVAYPVSSSMLPVVVGNCLSKLSGKSQWAAVCDRIHLRRRTLAREPSGPGAALRNSIPPQPIS